MYYTNSSVRWQVTRELGDFFSLVYVRMAPTISNKVKAILESKNTNSVKIYKLKQLHLWMTPSVAKNVEYALANIVNNKTQNIATRVNNARILLDPAGHSTPSNQYKGFFRRHGRVLNYSTKHAILTRKENINKLILPKVLTRAFFNKRVTPVKYMGGGVNGRVYATNNNRAIKFILGNHPEEYEALKILQSTRTVPSFNNRNGKVMKLTGNLKMAAKEMFGNTDNHMTAIIMGKVGGANPMTLQQYVNKYPNANKANINRRVRHILDQMGSKGISHGNFHANNIIVEVSPTGKIVRMWVIDFGRAVLLPLNMTPINLLKAATGKTHPAGSLYNKKRTMNVPLLGRESHRIDPHMAQVLGTKYLENNLYRIRNLRKFVHKEIARLPKSPRRVVTPTRRSKSVSPARRVVTPARRPNRMT